VCTAVAMSEDCDGLINWTLCELRIVFDDVIRLVATHAFFLLVGMILVLQWHVRMALQRRGWMVFVNWMCGPPTRVLRMMGLNIIILQMYYNSDEVFFFPKAPFSNSLIVIFIDNVIIWGIVQLLALCDCGQREKGEVHRQNNERLRNPCVQDPETPEEFQTNADCKYQMLLIPTRRILPIFLAQLSLFMLYVTNMNSSNDEKDITSVNFYFWFLAILIQLYAAGYQLGTSYNNLWWQKLFQEQYDLIERKNDRQLSTFSRSVKRGRIILGLEKTRLILSEPRKIFWVIPATYGIDWSLRQMMDWIINSVVRDCIKYTFPIMLCAEQPLDFIMDCTAIFFMTTLDDLTDDTDDSRRARITLMSKFQVFYRNWKVESVAEPLLLTSGEHKVTQDHESNETVLKSVVGNQFKSFSEHHHNTNIESYDACSDEE